MAIKWLYDALIWDTDLKIVISDGDLTFLTEAASAAITLGSCFFRVLVGTVVR